MGFKQIIPLIGALLDLGFQIADMIDQAEDIDPADKEALKARIKAAQAGVKYWEDDIAVAENGDPVVNGSNGYSDGPVSESKPVPDNG